MRTLLANLYHRASAAPPRLLMRDGRDLPRAFSSIHPLLLTTINPAFSPLQLVDRQEKASEHRDPQNEQREPHRIVRREIEEATHPQAEREAVLYHAYV